MFEDAELSRQLSFPADEWFAYVPAGANTSCWVALDAGRIIAVIQVDRDDSDIGYVDLAVDPSLSGQGLGTAILMAFLSGFGRAYAILEGRIAPDNAASIATFRRCGFEILTEPDADGLLVAIYWGPRKA